MPAITTRTLRNLRPKLSPYFVRDSKLTGFAVRVNPSGSIKYVAEVWHNGRSSRKTLGDYRTIDLQQAKHQALLYIHEAKSGVQVETAKEMTLRGLFNRYVYGDRLKPSTLKNYREVISFYLSDWLEGEVLDWIHQRMSEREKSNHADLERIN